MDTKKLRQKILDLAIRGKLVPQDSNDESAIELLKRINPEFEACDNTPRIYSIPNSWCWTTLGCVCDIVTGSTPSKTQLEYYGGEFPFYKPSDLDAGRHVTIPSEYLSEAGKKVSRIIPKDSTAICCIGSIGKCGYIEKEGTTNQQINTAVPSKGLNPLYLYYFCNSTFFGDNLSADSSAITISIVNKSKLGKMHMPIPPLAEQKRIVIAIEQWFSLIDILENEKSDLQASIQQAKSKILDLAIHGKLVPQDPNDEPAIELLKRINPKFEVCDEEECPFNIPSSWEWTKLGTISNYGNTINIDIQNIHQDAWVLELEDLEKDSAKIIKRVTKREREIKGVRHSFKKGDVLYSKLRTYLNKVLVAPEDGFCTTEIVPISFCHCVQPSYINHVLRSKYFRDYTIQCGYGVKMPRLSTTDACNGLIPLPPYSEQLRIVSKIEELFSVLDSIKESLA